jgi:7-cyano-7-deazaguanine synthase in queuosine biosynthesis
MGAEAIVLCGDLPQQQRGRCQVLYLNTSSRADPQHRIGLELDAIMRPFADNLPDVLADMLEVAAYVWAADRLVGRGAATLPDMGADWRRKLRFKIAVRCPALWNGPEVQCALVDTLEFLAEDTFRFEFFQRQKVEGIQPYFGFGDSDAQVINPDAVVLFSGGLDSTAGIVEQLLGDGNRVAVVTHRNAKMLARRQSDLLLKLRQRAPKRRLFDVPIWVTKGEPEPIEFTQRTRSFLFCALAMLVAGMFKKQQIVAYENGITSFNLPTAEHVLGTRASRTTHPRVFRGFERLFSVLINAPIEIRNPFLWRTKREVIDVLGHHGCADLIRDTVSCANVRQLPMTNKQCGVCIQCIERRFAVLAAGFGQEDPANGYAVDLFRGGHDRTVDITTAESHALRARRLASMSETAFAASYGQVFRALSSLPGPAAHNLRRIYDMHRLYGRYVVDVIDQELKKSAGLDKALSLPATCLLALINAPVGLQRAYKDAVEDEPPASIQALHDNSPIASRQILFAIDTEGRKALFSGGAELKGVGYDVFVALAEQYRQDREKGTPKDEYAFVKTNRLLETLKIDEQRLRVRIRTARTVLSRQFEVATDYVIDEQDIIQSRRWRGYRLNPYLVMVVAADLRRPEEKGKRAAE